MARIRTVRPEFWSDPGLFRLSRDARLCFIATWSFADDYGVLEDEPDRLRFQAFAGDPDADVAAWLRELIDARMLEAVVGADGEPLLRIRSFGTYQKIDRPSKSRFTVAGPREPAREDASTREPSGVLPNLSAKRAEPSAKTAAKRKRGKPDPDALPKDFPAELEPFVEPVLGILVELAEQTGATLPTRAGVARALGDYPRRDFIPVARNYRAWQLDGARRPHRNVVTGFRNQLDMAKDVARRAKPAAEGPKGTDAKAEETRRRMQEDSE